MLLSKSSDDETLILNSFAIQIQIAELIEHINNNPDSYEVLECDTNILINLNKTDRINSSVLNSMSNSRIEEPILIAKINDYEWVIDGNHRLQKRDLLSKVVTKYIPINGCKLDPFVKELSWRLK